MKTKRLFLLAIIALCSIHASMGLDLQKRVKGNEQFASEERLAEPFNSLSASGSIDIQIEYSPIQAPLRIEAESNIIPLIKTTVKKGVLNIEFEKKRSISPNAAVRVIVSVPEIQSVTLGGSGNLIFGSGFNQPTLKVTINGSGSINFIDTKAEQLDIVVNGSGDLRGSIFAHKDIRMNLKGSGNITLSIDETKTIRANMKGSGGIKLTGKASNTILRSSGSGMFNCQSLTTDHADIKMSGSGGGRLSVTKKISVNLSGSAGFTCHGKAKIGSYKIGRSSSFSMQP